VLKLKLPAVNLAKMTTKTLLLSCQQDSVPEPNTLVGMYMKQSGNLTARKAQVSCNPILYIIADGFDFYIIKTPDKCPFLLGHSEGKLHP
jgi:hypothetical protein